MSGSLWAKRASIFFISDVVDVDVDDDDPAIVRKARKLQQCVTNIRIYSDKRGEEVTHW